MKNSTGSDVSHNFAISEAAPLYLRHINSTALERSLSSYMNGRLPSRASCRLASSERGKNQNQNQTSPESTHTLKMDLPKGSCYPKLKPELVKTLEDLQDMLDQLKTLDPGMEQGSEVRTTRSLPMEVIGDTKERNLESSASQLALSLLEGASSREKPKVSFSEWRKSTISQFIGTGGSPFICPVPHLSPSARVDRGQIIGDILVPVTRTDLHRNRGICAELSNEVTRSWYDSGSLTTPQLDPTGQSTGSPLCPSNWGLGIICSSPASSELGEGSPSKRTTENPKEVSRKWEVEADNTSQAVHSTASSRSMSLASENSGDPYRHPDRDSFDEPFYFDRIAQKRPEEANSRRSNSF